MLSTQRAMAGSPAVRQLLITNNLRGWLTSAALKPQGSTGTSVLRLALREICADPDFQTEKPEQLLILFRLSLTEAADDANISPGPERTTLLDQVTTVFIEELFDGRTAVVSRGDG